MSNETERLTPLPLAVVQELLDEHFPAVNAKGRLIVIESVASMTATCRMRPHDRTIRPGGTISGPALFHIADYTIYVALIATLGETAISAVTSNLNINFLKRPQPKDVVAHATILRLGKRLAFADVKLFSEGSDELIAHATGSYALPVK